MRRRSILPGRYQPSTIDVLRLNFCVRYGNRWIPQAIATAKGELIEVPVSGAWVNADEMFVREGVHETSGSGFVQGASPG